MSDASAQPESDGHVDAASLLARHAAGDPDAFAPLARHVAPIVWGCLVRMRVAEARRDDLLQEVLLRLHRSAASYDPTRPLRPWVVTITVHAARDLARADARRPETALDVDAGAPAEAPANVIALETASFLEAELARLPASQRDAVVLCCVQQLSTAEAAAALGVPEGTLKTWLHRGRGALAAALTRRRATEHREARR